MPRPRCSVFIASSLDGFIARANGTFDFLSLVERKGEDYGYAAFFGSVDTLVMGKNTYDTALGFDSWPYAGKRVVVLTHKTLEPRHGVELHAGSLGPLLDRLGEEGVKHVYVDGGTVIAQFLAANLIDDLTLSIVPVMLGDGTPLAPKIGRDIRLRLTDHRAYESGLVQLRYDVER